MAVSSSIGSNIFDILVGLPLPWIFYTLIKRKNIEFADTGSVGQSVIILFSLVLLVILTIVAVGFKLSKGLGFVFFLFYAIFVAQDLLREYNVV